MWVAGLVALGAFGRSADWERFDPALRTQPFGPVGDALVAPAASWDAMWFLLVAQEGYDDAMRAAFFPLYPALVWLGGGSLLAALAISLVAGWLALWLVGELAALELGEALRAPAVWALALFPTSLFLSAAYSESLFLALSAGAFLAARRERFWLMALLGAAAAATRSAGLLLVVPLALLIVLPQATPDPRTWWRPSLRPQLAWVALVPLGTLAYVGFLAVAGEDPAAPFDAQEVWFRAWAGPFGGLLDGAGATWQALGTLAGGTPDEAARRNLVDAAFALFALVATAGVLRRLHPAYGAWCLAALSLPLSYPVEPEPLMSLPRFVLVLFPLHLWLALRWRTPAAALSAGGLALASALFTTWRWVA